MQADDLMGYSQTVLLAITNVVPMAHRLTFSAFQLLALRSE
jgi:hypothetical protein